MKRGSDTLRNKEFEFPSGIQQEAGMHHQHGQVQLPGKPHRTNLSGLQEKQRVSPSILTFERAVKANSSNPGGGLDRWTVRGRSSQDLELQELQSRAGHGPAESLGALTHTQRNVTSEVAAQTGKAEKQLRF